MSHTPHTAAVTDKNGTRHTLIAKARQVGLGWEGYVEDQTTGMLVLTVTQRQRTEAAARKLAKTFMHEWADNLPRK